MNKGRVLVYPPGHFCSKCGNTGYKQNDPSHPCRKDWEKYSKPFTAAFRLAPDQEPAANFQKPLRAFALSPPPPRGALCRNCGGRGNVVEFMSFFGDEETCPVCRGAGRVF
ncbi:hypothetical protein RQP46_006645 [Phenoliferia psychrophenolica]